MTSPSFRGLMPAGLLAGPGLALLTGRMRVWTCILLVSLTAGLPIFGAEENFRAIHVNPALRIQTEYYHGPGGRPLTEGYIIPGHYYGLPVVVNVDNQPHSAHGYVQVFRTNLEDRLIPTSLIVMGTAIVLRHYLGEIPVPLWLGLSRLGIYGVVEARTRPELILDDAPAGFPRLRASPFMRMKIIDALNGNAQILSNDRLAYPVRYHLDLHPRGGILKAEADFLYLDGALPRRERRPLNEVSIQNFCKKALGRLTGLLP